MEGGLSCSCVFSTMNSISKSLPAGWNGVLRFLKPKYKTGRPPIVLVAFGTSTNAQVTFDCLDKRIRAAFPGHKISWAFTSSIIRQKVNARLKKEGKERLYSLPQVLAALEADGYRKAVVQSLHVFPGEEYVHMTRQASIYGMDLAVGEPIFALWKDVSRVLGCIQPDIPEPEKGCAVLVVHGSPNTYSSPATSVYLALDRILRSRYRNCFLGSIEGVPDRYDALRRVKAYPGRHVRIIPLMLVAGDHVMNDIMGDKQGEGRSSWAMELRAAGKAVDCPKVEVDGKEYYKGLGFNEVVARIIIEHIGQAMGDL